MVDHNTLYQDILTWWDAQQEAPQFVKTARQWLLDQVALLSPETTEKPKKKGGRKSQAEIELRRVQDTLQDLQQDVQALASEMEDYCQSEYIRVFEDEKGNPNEKGALIPLRLIERLIKIANDNYPDR